MIKICFVCHGNICRSPMAEYIMQDLVNKKGLSKYFTISSAATSQEEIGNNTHYGTLQKMKEKGVPTWSRQARLMTKQDYQNNDYIVLMDDNNWHNTMKIIGSDTDGKVFKAMYFASKNYETYHTLQAPEISRRSPKDIKDPWYTGNFDETYHDILACCKGLLVAIMRDKDSDI